MSKRNIISPVDGSVYKEVELASSIQIEYTLKKAVAAQKEWKQTRISERKKMCLSMLKKLLAKTSELSTELTWQMGRPIRFASFELERGFQERAKYMIDIAEKSLADIRPGSSDGFVKYIKRDPLGIVFTIAPWNYPYLTAVNTIIPAIMAGNAVIIKHSSQTSLCAERLNDAFREAGFSDGIFQYLHLDHKETSRVISDSRINFVSFTGSQSGGIDTQHSIANQIKGIALELGGKDPAYVRPDVNLEHAIENIADGAFFNSGQSCCAIERVYVQESIYDAFVDGIVEFTKKYVLGNPLSLGTTLGPMVRTASADFVRDQIAEALTKGAKSLIDEALFPESKTGTPYLAPQILTDVNHSMSVMKDESFGPVLGIMKVKSDEEAISLMNDSNYGLTASVWTEDLDLAEKMGQKIETGTFYMNRCDYLDPALAWTAVKNSGNGCTLSSLGYEQLTRPKSFHLKTRV